MDIYHNASPSALSDTNPIRLDMPALSPNTVREANVPAPAAALSVPPLSPSPLALILGPAGAGKTEWAIRKFVAAWNTPRPLLLIVSSPQQAQTRAEQLAARLGCKPADVLPGLRTFRQLAAELVANLLLPTPPNSSQEQEPPMPEPEHQSYEEQDYSEQDYAEQVYQDERGEEPDIPSLRPIGRAFQRLALADLFRDTIRPDDFLGRMLRAPGFVPALSERVREWKLACLTPELLNQAGPALANALGDPTFTRKTAELARLFHAYESFLTRNRLRDDEDTLRLAVEGIRSGSICLPNNAVGVIVDGFYRFNPMQRRLLSALAASVHPQNGARVKVAVTLPYEASRPLLFAAPARTLGLLRHEFQCRETTLVYRSPARPASLALLGDRLFEAEKTDFPSSPLCSSVSLFDAPNPYVEAEMVARQFRRLYDGGGYAWSDFAVILRAMGDYAPILAAVFERHGIPLGVDGPEVLAENPFIKTLLFLLTVLRRGWQRDDVLAFLKSSYTAPDKLDADRLRRRARKSGLREGRDRWLALVANDSEWVEETSEEEKRLREEEETEVEEGAALQRRPSVAATLRDMEHYDALMTRERQDPRRFATLIEDAVTFFGLEERIAQGEPTRQERDRAAWSAAREVLRALAQMAALSGRQAVTFETFYDSLLAAWQGASSIAVAQGDMVRVAEPYDSRERPLKVAAVMGLTERVFPRRVTEDPFLRDEERAALREWAGLDLEEQKGRADDERFFFYLAVTSPSEHLILSYPRSADESDTLPSFYLDEVRRVFADQSSPVTTDAPALQPSNGRVSDSVDTDSVGAELDNAAPLNDHAPVSGLTVVSRTLADVAPRPDEVVSDADRLLAACAGLFDPRTTDGNGVEASLALLRTCMEHEESRSILKRVVVSRGLPRLPRLEDPALRRAFATNRKVFSVSELESYGRCPFQYFLCHVLHLHPDGENDHAREQGTMLHRVLHRFYAGRKAQEEKGERKTEKGAGDFSSTDMREALQRILAELLAQETMDVSPHQARMTHRLLADALDGFVTREERFGPQWGLAPAHFELAFGFGQRDDWDAQDGGGTGWNDEEQSLVNAPASAPAGGQITASFRVYDPASSAEPLLLNVTDGGPPVAICGTLDRVDLDTTGRLALVLDYKLGKPPEHSEIARGQSLQMPLYLLAMERVFGKVGAVACYDSPREPGRPRFHRSEHVSQRQFAPLTPLDNAPAVVPLNRGQYADLLKTAEATAIRLARSIVDGNIEATPGEPCRACAYKDVCRTANGAHDGETIPILPLQTAQE